MSWIPTFEELAAARVQLRELCRLHEASVLHFEDTAQGRFRHTSSDTLKTQPKPGRPANLSRITTTFTCIESLFDVHDAVPQRAAELMHQFTAETLDRPAQWMSEGAAPVYCRVRGLGPMLRLHPDIESLSPKRRNAIVSLCEQAWSSVTAEDRHGLCERTMPSGAQKWGQGNWDGGYPPNAYLTYWGLLALGNLSRAATEAELAVFHSRRSLAIQWMERVIANQIALGHASSRHSDPQQLAWAICAVVRSKSKDDLADKASARHELLSTGLQSFFDRQTGHGDWERGEPLFHYPQAGNAYCYTYETLAELLSLCDPKETENFAIMRGLLRPYAGDLLNAFEFAKTTQRPLGAGPGVGWCSGNHPHRPSPESWATASGFRFLQGLRRLVGVWTKDWALQTLGARSATDGLGTLLERGGTWDVGRGSAGVQLATSFVQPILHQAERPVPRGRAKEDPDRHVMEDTTARSAILYGPPGTSKSTLVESIAGALDWPFVEITPAQFLDEGVDRVSARADEIFRIVMELDHCVVLLDEIDQLIQTRDLRSESLERFFTTTMLPRLTKLWGLRKVLFFVNTNGIERVDPAIRRSQRFDLVIFVLPPGLATKREYLAEHGVALSVEVGDALPLVTSSEPSDEEIAGAWLRLLRHDQLQTLALRLGGKSGRTPVSVGGEALLKALEPLAGDLLALDWLDWDNSEVPAGENPGKQSPEFRDPPRLDRLAEFQRRDGRRDRVVRIDDPSLTVSGVSPLDATHFSVEADHDSLDVWARDQQLVLRPDGVIPGAT